MASSFVTSFMMSNCKRRILRLLARIQCVRPEFHRTGQWKMVRDNALAHYSIRVRQFFTQRGITVLELLFTSRLKMVMKGACFENVLAIQERGKAILRSISKKASATSFQKLCQKCVVLQDDYFESQSRQFVRICCFLYSVIVFTELLRRTYYRTYSGMYTANIRLVPFSLQIHVKFSIYCNQYGPLTVLIKRWPWQPYLLSSSSI